MACLTIISNCHCKHVSFIMGRIKNDELIIFTKTNRSTSYQLFLISIISSNIVIIAFHLHDRTMWIITIVHVHWTKLESTNIYFKGENNVIWLFVRTTIMYMRVTQHFYRGLLLLTQRKEKRNSKKHTEIFLEFFFLKEVKQE